MVHIALVSEDMRTELRARLDGMGRRDVPVTRTMLWHYWVDSEASDPASFFFEDPPVHFAYPSNRVLFTGTSSQLSSLYDIIEELQASKGAYRSPLLGGDFRLPIIEGIYTEKLKRILDEEVVGNGATPVYCSQMGDFWGTFFDRNDFLDGVEGRTVPRRLVATGEMRNYSYAGGETGDVAERLAEIAKKWRIPIDFIGASR